MCGMCLTWSAISAKTVTHHGWVLNCDTKDVNMSTHVKMAPKHALLTIHTVNSDTIPVDVIYSLQGTHADHLDFGTTETHKTGRSFSIWFCNSNETRRARPEGSPAQCVRINSQYKQTSSWMCHPKQLKAMPVKTKQCVSSTLTLVTMMEWHLFWLILVTHFNLFFRGRREQR